MEVFVIVELGRFFMLLRVELGLGCHVVRVGRAVHQFVGVVRVVEVEDVGLESSVGRVVARWVLWVVFDLGGVFFVVLDQ